MPLLFSYGTLQQEDVQVSTFGRRLAGSKDAITGFEKVMVKIEDPRRAAEAARTHNANLVAGGKDSRVEGTALEVTDAELAAADEYEKPDGYVRIVVALASGRQAWVYVDSRTVPAAGMRKGLTSYGDTGFSLFLRKAFIKGAGYTDAALDRPVVGIADTGSGYNPAMATPRS
jgi:hypothetical protein